MRLPERPSDTDENYIIPAEHDTAPPWLGYILLLTAVLWGAACLALVAWVV